MKKVALYTDQEGNQIKVAHPVKAEAILRHITERTSQKGMVVNGTKTALMCVTAVSSYQASAEITDLEGNKIVSSPSSRFLGVTLDANCSWATHVDSVRRKLRARAWTLNSLRRSGFSEEELVRVYCAHI